MTDTIKRWECPECRVTWIDPPLVYAEKLCEHHAIVCPGVPVERTYVLKGTERQEFIDALLGEDAIRAARKRTFGSHAACSNTIRAAINAVTKEKR